MITPEATILVESPIGRLVLAASGECLTDLMFLSRKESAPREVPGSGAAADVLRKAERQLGEYFAGDRTEFSVALEFRGTTFQQEAWRGLLTIPYGQTVSYGEQARRIGRPKAVRAIGAANGANPIPVIVPCHRVIGADGSLTGYGGGMEIKKKLLILENPIISARFPP
jgi:methylated-DNA-[protein]-cysteine S-methyltransferase